MTVAVNQPLASVAARLNAWAAELKPPGLSTEDSAFTRHHEEMFAEHQIIAGAPAPANPAPEPDDGSIQGWIARNGTLAVKNGALVLMPEKAAAENARAFLTNSRLDIAGLATAILKVRAVEVQSIELKGTTGAGSAFQFGEK